MKIKVTFRDGMYMADLGYASEVWCRDLNRLCDLLSGIMSRREVFNDRA